MAGDDLTCEIVARALSAAGVGRIRLVRRSGATAGVAADAGVAVGALPPAIAAALAASNPDVHLEIRAWPAGQPADAGAAWLDAVTGAAVVVRSGFDDDSMLRAAVRLAIPVIVTRGRDESVEVVSFRRHGPCPHAPLDVPEQTALPPEDGPGAVIAGNIAAAEALMLIARATTGEARARHISLPMTGVGDHVVRATDIPWTPECFACGGSGSEMSFS